MAVGTKEGYLFIYDRDTHALISKSEVVPRLNADLPFSDKPLRVCPGTASGVEWNGPTYDPRNKSVFVNSVHWCATWTARKPEGKKPGSWYVEADLTMDPMDKLRGYTHAFDAATGKKLWAREAPLPMIGGITATAGGVVLTGGADGMFLALDPRDGKELYRFNTGGGIGGGVSTYTVGGRQYVAVAAGGYGLSPFGMTGSPAVLVFALPQGK
jgi:outer membrane protein assembly factor BamB